MRRNQRKGERIGKNPSKLTGKEPRRKQDLETEREQKDTKNVRKGKVRGWEGKPGGDEMEKKAS